MPLHRNECSACGNLFRTLDLAGAECDAACPACGERNTRRLLPRVAVQFKGHGFYRTDHPRCGRDAAAEPGQSAAEES